ncbi:DUF5625 family protein (plasmid) [Ralstonia pseudosolanacearum]
MKTNKKNVRGGFIFCALALAVFGGGGMAAESEYPFISLDKAGSSVSREISVDRDSGWTVEIAITYPGGGVAFDDPRVVRLNNLVDDVSGGGGVPRKPHRGIRLRLKVTKFNGPQSEVVREKTIDQEPLHGNGGGAALLSVDGFRLSPGSYAVSIEVLDDDPRFAGVDAHMRVGVKPFTYEK